MSIMKKIFYESNACFGPVDNVDDLIKMIDYQLEENNQINSLDDFLDKSMQDVNYVHSFGTYKEHCGEKSLRVFLEESNFDFELLNKYEK